MHYQAQPVAFPRFLYLRPSFFLAETWAEPKHDVALSGKIFHNRKYLFLLGFHFGWKSPEGEEENAGRHFAEFGDIAVVAAVACLLWKMSLLNPLNNSNEL